MTLPATQTIRQWNRRGDGWVDVLYILNSDGLTYSQSIVVNSNGGWTGLTDAQLRATALPVSGPLTDTQLRATALPVSGPLTDTQLRATAVPTSDAGPAWTSSRGLAGLPFLSADQHSTPASVTDAPTSTKKLCITDLVISVDTQMSVAFKEETSGTVVAGPYYMTANSILQITPRGKFKLPTADKKLQVLTSAAGNITVSAYYYSE